jgi:lysozyme
MVSTPKDASDSSLKESGIVTFGTSYRFCSAILTPSVAVLLAVSFACRSGSIVPSVDRDPSAELTSPTRALPPMNFSLRAISPQGLSLTKSSEGWVPYRYNDAARYCSIGYGHLIKKAPCDGTEPAEFLRRLSEPRGEQILLGDMASSRYAVMTSVEVKLTDGEFAALSDFVFNVGSRNFLRSTLLKVINSEEEERVSIQFRRWVLAGGKTRPGLVRRRELEIDLFFQGRPKVRGVPLPGEDLSPLDVLSDEGQGR